MAKKCNAASSADGLRHPPPLGWREAEVCHLVLHRGRAAEMVPEGARGGLGCPPGPRRSCWLACWRPRCWRRRKSRSHSSATPGWWPSWRSRGTTTRRSRAGPSTPTPNSSGAGSRCSARRPRPRGGPPSRWRWPGPPARTLQPQGAMSCTCTATPRASSPRRTPSRPSPARPGATRTRWSTSATARGAGRARPASGDWWRTRRPPWISSAPGTRACRPWCGARRSGRAWLWASRRRRRARMKSKGSSCSLRSSAC